MDSNMAMNERLSGVAVKRRFVSRLLTILAAIVIHIDARAAEPTPPSAKRWNILFCFADDWARARGSSLSQRVRPRAELHAVSQFASLWAILLPHRSRRDPQRRGLGSGHSDVSASAARRRLSDRRIV
jgi:hypothetical protein